MKILIFGLLVSLFVISSGCDEISKNPLIAAAENGDLEAQKALGHIYYFGKGGSFNKDVEKSVFWYKKAAESGDVMSEYMLGYIYSGGGFVNAAEYNRKESLKWFLRAANNGDEVSQYEVGLANEQGDHFSKDPNQAAYWYRRSAEQGNCKSQARLGDMYVEGVGVIKDYATAYAYYNLASGNSDCEPWGAEESRLKRKRMEEVLTKEQLSEGMRISRELLRVDN